MNYQEYWQAILQGIQAGMTYEHRELIDPFDHIMLVTKVYRDESHILIETYEDGSLIEAKKTVNDEKLLSIMRAIGRDWV